jgi:hypothetical protein
MRYYYVISLEGMNRKEPNWNIEITNHINKYGFRCMDKNYITELSLQLDMSFCNTLKKVFTSFLHIEHYVREIVCDSEAEIEKISGFTRKYYDQVMECKDKRKVEKCRDLEILHEEDKEFIYEKRDTYLYSLEGDENVSKYQNVVILLDENCTYIGHIYMWSWLTHNNRFSGHMYTLEFGGIRTSLLNLLCGGIKDIALSFVAAVSTWAKEHQWEYLEVAFEPIGPMPNYLKKCGFSDKNVVKISNITCLEEVKIKEIKENCNIHSYYGEDTFEQWYSEILLEDEPILRSSWIDYKISSKIHKLLMMSYPDRKVTAVDIEWAYITTFNSGKAYLPKHKEIPIEQYCGQELQFYITHLENIPINLNRTIKQINILLDDFYYRALNKPFDQENVPFDGNAYINLVCDLFRLKVETRLFALWNTKCASILSLEESFKHTILVLIDNINKDFNMANTIVRRSHRFLVSMSIPYISEVLEIIENFIGDNN